METIKDIMMMMQPNCLFATTDFKHVFFCQNYAKR